jgi:hypothetical protein
MPYQISVSDEQARVLQDACELYARSSECEDLALLARAIGIAANSASPAPRG